MKIKEAVNAYERALELEPNSTDRFQTLENARNLLAGTFIFLAWKLFKKLTL